MVVRWLRTGEPTNRPSDCNDPGPPCCIVMDFRSDLVLFVVGSLTETAQVAARSAPPLLVPADGVDETRPGR